MTVAYMGNAMNCLNVSIHSPGLGNLNFVRAQTRPYPGAFAKIGENLIRIWKCRPFDTRIRFDGAMYGTVVEKFSGKLLIQCRGGLLLVDDWEKIKE